MACSLPIYHATRLRARTSMDNLQYQVYPDQIIKVQGPTLAQLLYSCSAVYNGESLGLDLLLACYWRQQSATKTPTSDIKILHQHCANLGHCRTVPQPSLQSTGGDNAGHDYDGKIPAWNGQMWQNSRLHLNIEYCDSSSCILYLCWQNQRYGSKAQVCLIWYRRLRRFFTAARVNRPHHHNLYSFQFVEEIARSYGRGKQGGFSARAQNHGHHFDHIWPGMRFKSCLWLCVCLGQPRWYGWQHIEYFGHFSVRSATYQLYFVLPHEKF